ncbi:MAG: ATP-binding protein [Bacteroidia bacterium]|nr:ATP-binding protein [Bacteroidia bacterium]
MNKMVIPFFLFFLTGIVLGQPSPETEHGSPFLKNFSAADYKAHAQNFAVVRDRDGILYAGNFAGVLQYDGEFWRLIPTAKTTKVSALGIDSAGTVFVGALGEIGLLRSNSRGELFFQTLIDTTGAAVPDFQEVFQILSAPDGVYFITKKVIFRWHQGKLDHWSPENEIISGSRIYQTIYLQVKEKGLMIFRNGTFNAVAKGEMVTGAIEIKAMMPYPGNQVLIATGTQGLYMVDSNGVRKFITPSDDLFMKNLITTGVALSDGSYAIGTSRKGVIVMYPNGNVKQIIDNKATLRNENVQALFADENNLLWAALNNGIAMIEVPSPLTFFDEKSGLNGAVIDILRCNGRLYVSTYQGLFFYDRQSFGFQPVPEIITACWSLVPFGNDLLAATSQGVFQISNQHAKMIREGFVLSLACSATDPSTVFIGETGGLAVMNNRNGSWKSREIAGVVDEIHELLEDARGNIWGSTLTKGIFRYSPKADTLGFFTASSGLSETAGSTINLIGGRMSVSTRTGVFLFDDASQTFRMTMLVKTDTTAESPWFSKIAENQHGDLWVNAGDESHIMLLEKKGESFEPYQLPFLPIADYVIWAIFPEPGGVTWFGGPDGLIRYDQSVRMLKPDPNPTLIRLITTPGDSVIFAGNKVRGDSLPVEINTFKYQNNSLRFEFSAPFYSPKGENQYQYILEGFEDTWSDWTTQTQKEYTNLPKGKFTFKVKGRNVYEKTAQEAKFSFRILSPWHTTLWAYFIYFFLAAAVIYLFVVVRNRQLIREKRTLEQRIADRTAEVVQQKEEIVKQSDELADKNDELEKINTTVKSINSEINFEKLLQSLLEKMKVIRSVEKSTALVFDKNAGAFKFKASFGWELRQIADVKLSLDEAEKRYLKNAEEVYEDVFLKTDFSTWEGRSIVNEFAIPKTMLVLVIRVENKVEAFLILENMNREHAFQSKDLSFIRNSKEHIISAFIRTRILEDLQLTLQNLKDTQDQLVQSEKLASLGALIAGIAHEIQNPLNFVNNFSSLSADLADELLDFLNEMKDTLTPAKYADIGEVIGMIKGNVEKIHDHGQRAESIVKGMLQHSRGKTGEFEQVAINNLVSEYVNLAYHGMRAKDKSFNTSIKTQLDPEVGKASIIPQDLSRVILNIVNNSCYALDEKVKKGIPGYSPEVIISTKKIGDKIEIGIRDNGTGIPEQVREKIFNPFFTTKPTGQGTGLGLSLSFDIVTQIHKGKLEVRSKEGEFTEFIITIPEKQS